MIIGITGTQGGGKGTVVDYLVEKKGFAHYSASAFIIEEIKRRDMPINRVSMREVGNDLRKIHFPEYIIDVLHNRALEHGGDAIIEAIREVAGAKFLKSHGAHLIAVDADRRIRYERAVERNSEKDQVSFEDFCIQEDRELAEQGPHEMNILGVMDIADVKIENNGTREELIAQVEAALTQFNFS